ncbi:stealth conserved region 3 domain-containing protein [Planktotalea sp.]|uniref:stealth conserved region 3 domain-containing protein n=1 Tax=Planktotalea sp. TaxID=2029877 RepID=UPI003D6B9225
MNLLKKIRKYKTPKALAKAIARKLSGQKGSSGSLSPISPNALERTRALKDHAFLASPEIAKLVEALIQDAARDAAVIVFQAERGNLLKVGMRHENFLAFAALCEAHFKTLLHWNSNTFKQASTKDRGFAPLLSDCDKVTAQVLFGPQISLSIEVDIYRRADGGTNSANERNSDLRYIRGNLQKKLDTPACHFIEDLLDGVSSQTISFPIDVVYTWVNHEDAEWKKLYAAAKSERDQSRADDKRSPNEPYGETDTSAMSRFKNRQELKYSLRSVEQYMPWVRNIYIFSNCAKPDWLGESDTVVWVRHEEVIAPEHLPTFSSHAIESYLHKIPKIAEHFIYFNDDFFVNNALPAHLFFTANGVTQANLEEYGTVNGLCTTGDPDYLNAARNGVGLLHKEFGMVPTRLHKHSPYAMTKSLMTEMENRFHDDFERTRAGKFRSQTDISTASFLFHHYGFATKATAYHGFRAKLVKNTTTDLQADFLKMVEGSNVRTFCLNDGDDSHDDTYWNDQICMFLERRFPLPTRAETAPR